MININDITSQEYQFFYSLMSSSKKKQVDGFRFEEDKKRTVAGEMLARELIADFCGVDIESILFYANEFGKPFAKSIDVEFNISHSGDKVICAVSNAPVGVDIEERRSVTDYVIKLVCTAEESDYVLANNISEEEKNNRFYEIWTFKEAYFKCMGTGITDFHSVNYFDKKHSTHLKRFAVDNYAVCIYCK